MVVARRQASAHAIGSSLAQNPPILMVPVHIADQRIQHQIASHLIRGLPGGLWLGENSANRIEDSSDRVIILPPIPIRLIVRLQSRENLVAVKKLVAVFGEI